MSIHTTGDSHSFNGWTNIINHHLGPILCYSFGKDKLARCNISNFNLQDGDTIVFCFGEIDCRCHINKYINNEITYEAIIDDIVNNYFDAIKLNISLLNVNLKNICVYNIVPPIKKNFVEENPNYPYLGSDEERKKYTLYFNKKLKEKCFEYKYIFFDVYDKYSDTDGFLNKELSDGNVHISNGIHIADFISLNLLD